MVPAISHPIMLLPLALLLLPCVCLAIERLSQEGLWKG
jgi:hypothetical protein